MTAPPDDNAADLYGVIAALRSERDALLVQKTALVEELAARTAELLERKTKFGEQIAQQAATIDVLKVMSASPGDPQPVFDLIVERARACCDAELAALTLLDGDLLWLNATSGMTAARTQEFARAYPLPVSQAFAGGRAILMRDTVQVPDTQVDPGFAQRGTGAWHRSVLAVPLLHAGLPIGAIGLGRATPGTFSTAQVELLKIFAEQAVIAIGSAETFRALQERTETLATRNSEYGERIEHQSATIDVLKAMSASPGDTQPVFDLIVRRAVELCNAQSGGLFEYDGERVHIGTIHGLFEHDGELLHVQSLHGTEPEIAPASLAAYLRQFPMPPKRGSISMRAILDCQIIHIRDMQEVVDLLEDVQRLGHRSQVSLPLLRDARAIGVITIAAHEPGGFSDSQIALLKTFAEQAVIAISSAETYRALQERTHDLQESLEYQTATSDVLQTISRAAYDLDSVLTTLLVTAERLCDANHGQIWRKDGEVFRHAASHMNVPAYREREEETEIRSGRGTLVGRVALEGRPVLIADAWHDPEYAHQKGAHLAEARSMLGVPLLRDGELIGAFALARRTPVPFTDRQVDLVRTFADQAVIAMENARLITEQRKALEQQIATAEVLQVINTSPGNLAPVFEVILEKAHRLCGVTHGSLELCDGETFRAVATLGFSDAFADILRRGYPGRDSPDTRSLIDGARFSHILDLAEMNDGMTRSALDLDGHRTLLCVPLRRDGQLLGMIASARKEVRAFTDKEVALLENFAAQAVIAMENARLINEQREALEQQTATAEVLQVINASPGDLTPVFDAVLEKAMRLCGAAFGSLYTYDGERFHSAAQRGVPPAYAEFREKNPPVARPGSVAARIIETRGPVQSRDVIASENYHAGSPSTRALVELGGIRAVLNVPLLKEGALLGVIAIYREEPGTFSDKQIALLENFAAQAVIAMENARLINEQREALEQQTATAEVLGVINASPGDLLPVFDAILEKAHSLCGAAKGALVTFDGQHFRAVASRGLSETYAKMLREPRSTTRGSLLERLLSGASFVLEDTSTSPLPLPRAATELEGVRTVLIVPLRRDSSLLGYITALSQEVRPFTDKHIALLQNFAAQAVIAMENARLIDEQREALEQQQAIAEILQAINRSPGDLQPVFDILLDKAMRLCEAAFGILAVKEGEETHTVAAHGLPPALADWRSNHPVINAQNTLLARVMAGEPYIHTLDLKDDDLYRRGEPLRRANVDLGGARTSLYVPLTRDRDVLGTIHIYRQEVRPFNDKQIALLQNFAAQAVIAMENGRLLDEIRQRQEELRITFENMGDGVAMFDETQHLIAWNRKFQDILDVPDDIIARRQTFSEYISYLAERGEYGREADPKEHVRRLIEQAGQSRTYERTRPDGRVIEIRHIPVAGGGFVLIYADITERKRSEAEIRAARDAAEEASRTIEAAYRELKTAQANLIQAEKMASLGQLTAGIAHEIKNPLNFVNNFAALSVDLLSELKETAAPGFAALTEKQRAEVDEVSSMLTSNLEKITEHGKRAYGIVKAMLEHSRGSSGERHTVDLNALIDEALNLAYHGARAQDQSFNITLQRNFGEGIAPIEVNPQDMTRVFLNLFANGFYATTRRARDGGNARFVPTLKVTTWDVSEAVEIRVRDNGIGIPADIRDKLFQPFFTTKPTGEGTGLGLSITYDIVTQQHGGSITVDSEVGEYSEFAIRLPRNP